MGLFSDIGGWFVDVGEAAWDEITSMPDEIYGAFSDFGNNIYDAYNKVEEWFSDGSAQEFVEDITGITEANVAEEQLNLAVAENYSSNLGNLNDYTSTFSTLLNKIIPELNDNISALNTDIANWQSNYDLETDKIQAQIDTYDSLLANWQTEYDAQTLSAQATGKSNLDSLMANWSDSEAIAASRGASGSASLVAGSYKDKVVDYAGADMSLSGGDGIYGASYDSLVSSLNFQKNQYSAQSDILNDTLSVTQQNMNAELSQMQGQLGVYETVLGASSGQMESLYASIQSAYDLAVSSADAAGIDYNEDPAMQEYADFLEKYKEYAKG